MISWLSFGVTTGDRSFLGTSSMIAFISIFSETPFWRTLAFSEVVLAPAVFRLDTFDTVVTFLIGKAAVVVFVVEDARLAVVVVVVLVEERVVLVVVRAMEICLLAVSFTCLSIIGDFPDNERGFAAIPVVGTLFGLEIVVGIVVVAGLDLVVALVLAVVVADTGLVFVVVVKVDVFVVVVFGIADLVVGTAFVVVEVLVGTAGLLRGLTSPFAVGFFSLGVGFEAVVAGFGFVVAFALNLVAGFVVAVVVVVFEVGFAANNLLLVAIAEAVFFGASRSFGRGVDDASGFLAAPANPRVVEVTDFEGDVGFDFCPVFGTAVFDNGLEVIFIFALLCVTATAPTALAPTAVAAAATAAISKIFVSEASGTFSVLGSFISERTASTFSTCCSWHTTSTAGSSGFSGSTDSFTSSASSFFEISSWISGIGLLNGTSSDFGCN